jgi:uncharacterized protein HemX
MGKNKKNIKEETESESESEVETTTDTETDTDTDKKYKKNKKSFMNKFNKKTKLYAGIIVLLLAIAAFMWYKNKKNKSSVDEKIQINEPMKHLSPVEDIKLTQGAQAF